MKESTHARWLYPAAAILCLALTAGLLLPLLTAEPAYSATPALNVNLVGTYSRNLTNLVGEALEGTVSIQRTYELSDNDVVAPAPDPDCFGQTQDPAQMQAVLDRAAPLLQGQKTLFTPDVQIREGSTIQYYLDETILAITWKQVLSGCVYTFAEVKIAHPSQMRRFLSEGKYNSGILHTTTEMSQSVNAVVASSGDFYAYRHFGIVVNQGQVYRHLGEFLDTCYIDENGDLLFTYAKEITDKETAQKFVDDHNIRYSLSFGPLMILDGEYVVPRTYNSGEIHDAYARAALCQMDKLHYVVVAANTEGDDYHVPNIPKFGQELFDLGIPTAYALDGGQTASIAINHQLVNKVSYGSQREISDILYFATALPEKKEGQ